MNILPPILFVGVLWLVEMTTGARYDGYGILPHNTHWLQGIFIMPFLHTGMHHLEANTLPLIVFGVMVAWQGGWGWITFLIVALGGALVWELGNPRGCYLGASGIIYGYTGLMIARGMRMQRVRDVLFAVVAIAGSTGLTVYNLGHWTGFAVGVVIGFVWREKRKENYEA